MFWFLNWIYIIDSLENNSVKEIYWNNILNKPSTFPPDYHTQASNTISSMQGYRKATYYGASINVSDDLNTAMGKLERNIESKLSGEGNVTINGSLTVTREIYSNGNVTAYSDKRLKENFSCLNEEIISKIKQINLYNFEMKSDKKHRKRVGVIAQELEEIFPELVFTDEDGIKSVDYIGLLTYFAYSIQSLFNSTGGDIYVAR